MSTQPAWKSIDDYSDWYSRNYVSWWCLRCGSGPFLMTLPIIGSEICSCGCDLLVTHTDKKVERYGPPDLRSFVAGEMTACLL